MLLGSARWSSGLNTVRLAKLPRHSRAGGEPIFLVPHTRGLGFPPDTRMTTKDDSRRFFLAYE